VDLQQVIEEIENTITKLDDIENSTQEKVSVLEDIQDRATNTRDVLQTHVDNLTSIDEAISDAESVVSDAEYENVI